MNIQEFLDPLRNDDYFAHDIKRIYQKNSIEQALMRKYATEHGYNPNGIDHYYHRKTVYEAAQKGQNAANMMLILGALKESKDLVRDTYKLGSLKKAWAESEKDLQNNILGYRMGLNNALPPESNPEFNQYNSNTVNAILEALKAKQ